MKIIKNLFILIGLIVLGFIALAIFANYRFIGLTKAIYGIDYKQLKHIYVYDPERDFHGDGFSIKVDSVSTDDLTKFEEIFTRKPGVYPKRHYHLGEREIRKWKITPFRQSDSIPINFATTSDTIMKLTRDSEAIKYLALAKVALEENGNYYAFFFRDHPYKLYGVDLFIVSPKRNMIIDINRQ